MSALRKWLDGDERRFLWVEFEAYARRVFANSPADWYADASRFASTLIQAQGIIPTQCLSVDLCGPLLSTPDLQGDAAGAGDIVDALANDTQLDFVNHTLDALLHRFSGQLDLVVALKAPADLLARGGGSEPPEFDDLDDLATAMSNVLRPLAEKQLAGLLLEKRGPVGLTVDEIDAYEPLISAARHYGWVTAISLPDQSGLDVPDLDLDVVLLPGAPPDAIVPDARAPAYGGGLNEAFWGGAGIEADTAAGRLLYGSIPDTANPETVLAVLRELG